MSNSTGMYTKIYFFEFYRDIFTIVNVITDYNYYNGICLNDMRFTMFSNLIVADCQNYLLFINS